MPPYAAYARPAEIVWTRVSAIANPIRLATPMIATSGDAPRRSQTQNAQHPAISKTAAIVNARRLRVTEGQEPATLTLDVHDVRNRNEYTFVRLETNAVAVREFDALFSLSNEAAQQIFSARLDGRRTQRTRN
jgi:hypothetical protein